RNLAFDNRARERGRSGEVEGGKGRKPSEGVLDQEYGRAHPRRLDVGAAAGSGKLRRPARRPGDRAVLHCFLPLRARSRAVPITSVAIWALRKAPACLFQI